MTLAKARGIPESHPWSFNNLVEIALFTTTDISFHTDISLVHHWHFGDHRPKLGPP